jgi:hypothetical protein
MGPPEWLVSGKLRCGIVLLMIRYKPNYLITQRVRSLRPLGLQYLKKMYVAHVKAKAKNPDS